MLSIRSLRAAATALSLVVVASSASAQTVTAAYSPFCGPGTMCSLIRFTFSNASSSTLLFNTLTLTASSSTFAFSPVAGGLAAYQAEDAVGPFGGFGSANVGGTTFDIDFLGGNGFQFELDPGSTGFIEAALDTTPTLPPNGAFTYSATIDGMTDPIGGAVTSASTTAPEPATFALVGGGLALVGFASRRRRAV